MANMVQDMTTGKEVPLLLKFTIPLLIGNLFQQCYSIVDSAIVGHVEGANALGAIGCTNWITYIFFACCNGVGIGAGILVAQFFGASKRRNIRQAIANSFYIILLLGVALSVLGFLITEPVLILLGTPDGQLEQAIDYMQIICSGTFAVALYNYVANVMRALGDSKTPLLFLLIASFLNIALDVIFVVELGFGVKGAAYATVLAQLIAAIFSMVYAVWKNPYFRMERRDLKFNKELVVMCFQIGMPLAAQSMMISLSCVILQSMVNRFDEAVVSAFTVTSKVELLLDQPFIALSSAISTFTGQNMGAGKQDRVKKAFRWSVLITTSYCVLVAVAIFLFDEQIARLFVQESYVIDISAMALRIMGIMYWPLGMIFIIRGLLNGAGDAGYALTNGIVEVAGRIGFSVLFVFLLPVGMWSVWIATGLTWCLTAFMAYLRYRKGIWKTTTKVTT
ncbi:MAG: MATE family efflux transporter [Lachnospiraceae bacterium]|nr:MATE family efflux transporter [Lachnospiraceae bacterium]